MIKTKWLILGILGLFTLMFVTRFLTEKPAVGRPAQIEMFSIKALASGELPTIPENVHTIYIPNFESTSIQDLRAAIANVRIQYPQLKIVPYLPVRKYTKTEALELLQLYRDAQINELLVLAGGTFPDAKERGAYPSTAEFLKELDLKELGFKTIGVAAHPEYHFTMDAKSRMEALKEKYTLARQQGLNFYLVTQVVCNPSRFVSWQQEVRAQGIDSPIFYGVLLSKLDPSLFKKFMLQMCQAITSDATHPDYDEEAIRLIHTPEEQEFAVIEAKLKMMGAPVDGFHFYLYGGNLQETLNRLKDL